MAANFMLFLYFVFLILSLLTKKWALFFPTFFVFLAFIFRKPLSKKLSKIQKIPKWLLYLFLIFLFDGIFDGSAWIFGFRLFEGIQLWEVFLLIVSFWMTCGLILYSYYKKFCPSIPDLFIATGLFGLIVEVPKTFFLWHFPLWLVFLWAIWAPLGYAYYLALPLYLIKSEKDYSVNIKKIFLILFILLFWLAIYWNFVAMPYKNIFHPDSQFNYEMVRWGK